MAERPKVLVCNGRRCGKEHKALEALVEALAQVADIEQVGCQKICAGPVAGTEIDGTLEWFRGLRSDKRRRRMVKLVVEGKLTKRMKKRHVSKRSGQLRGERSSRPMRPAVVGEAAAASLIAAPALAPAAACSPQGDQAEKPGSSA